MVGIRKGGTRIGRARRHGNIARENISFVGNDESIILDYFLEAAVVACYA